MQQQRLFSAALLRAEEEGQYQEGRQQERHLRLLRRQT